MYNALDVAKYIIKFENSNDRSVSNLRLQKLLYFIQCAFIINFKYPCFYNDIEAWDFGAVIPDVYHKYNFFGSASIPNYYIKHYNFCFLIDEQKIVDSVITLCSKYNNTQLTKIIQHQEPWIYAFQMKHTLYKSKITNELIYDFFYSNNKKIT